MDKAEDCDVLVIGAGVAGLNAARLLHQAGLRVTVLEGRDRIAGRLWTYRDEKVDYLDMGGMFVGESQTAVMSVLKELDLQTYPIKQDLKSLLCLKSGRYTAASGGVPMVSNPLALLDVNNVVQLVEKYSQEVPLDAPWTHPRAEEWDRMSVHDFVKNNTYTSAGRFFGNTLLGASYLTDSKCISFLCMLWHTRCSGGLAAALAMGDGLQESKVVGGAGSICDKLRDMLPHEAVHVNTRVSEVLQQDSDTVIVSTHCNKKYKAKRVISSVPIPGLANIDFSPPLPPAMKQWSEEEVNCKVFKVFTCYETAFWREKGFCGEMMKEDGLVSMTMDYSKSDGSRPALVGFIYDHSHDLASSLSKYERQKMICAQYAEDFGMDEFLSPTSYIEKDWADDEEEALMRKASLWSLAPGVLTKIKSIPEDVHGNVYFMGSEMAITMPGYMDGALRTSVNSVQKVLESLGHDSSSVVTADMKEKYAVIHEIPYIPGGIEKYVPSVPQFLVGVGVVLGVVVVGAVLLGVFL